MATVREKRPGVWEVPVFTGADARGRPTEMSRAMRGGKRDAQKLVRWGWVSSNVAGRLGHANPAMTLRVYAHAFAAADQAVAAGLGDILEGDDT